MCIRDRPAEAAVAVKFVHKGIPAKKAQKKRANAGGARGGERQGVQYLAVLHLTSKGEGVSCPSNDILRSTRHGCVFLEVCRPIDNTSVLVLKMLVVCIEAHV